MNVKYILILLALAWMIAGCRQEAEEPVETVEERAQARWDYLIGGEAGRAWEYYTPGFREMTDRRDFAYDNVRRPVRWLSAEVLRAECDADRCAVYTRVRYHAPSARSGMGQVELERELEENWIRLDGQWWYVQN